MAQNLEKFTLDIYNYTITNAEDIIEAINNEEDYTYLQEYYNNLITKLGYNNYENLNIILSALESRLRKLQPLEVLDENNPLNELLDTYATLEDIFLPAKNYINSKKIDEIELKKIYAYLSNAISILEHFPLEPFENEVVETLINYIGNKERNKYEEALIAKYYKHLDKPQNTSTNINNGRKKTYGISGNPAPLLLGDTAFSLTIIIITVTVLLGAIIAALLLVK